MSSSQPPNPNTPPVFNNDAYNYGTAGGIDIDFLNANYLNFPVAQGAETINSLNTTTHSNTNQTTSGTLTAGTANITGTLTAGTFAPTTINCNTLSGTAVSSAISLYNESTRSGAINIGTGLNNTSGAIINIGTGANSAGRINIGTGTAATGAVFLKTGTSTTGCINIGICSNTNPAANVIHIGTNGSAIPVSIGEFQTSNNIGDLSVLSDSAVSTCSINPNATGNGCNTLVIGNSASSINMASNVLITQTTYPPATTTQLGYTIQKTFGPTNASDTTGTYSNIGSQALPAVKGVYNIVCGFTLTASGNDTNTSVSVVLSLTSGTSGTEVNAFGAWRYFTEQDDVMGGGGGLRYVGMLGGTYINSTGSAATLYLNAYAPTTGAITMSVQGNCSITKIA